MRSSDAVTSPTVCSRTGQLPDGWDFADVGGVAVDRHDRVYVFNRGGHPIIVFNRDGSFAASWGDTLFKRPHAVHRAPDGTIWCTDEGRHAVYRCTLEGERAVHAGHTHSRMRALVVHHRPRRSAVDAATDRTGSDASLDR